MASVRARTGWAAAAVAVIACMTATAAPASGEGGLSPCRLPGLDRPALCGTFERPEHPDRPDGRRISVAVAVVPASDGPALPDPIVPLMGGPGEDTLSAAADFAERFASLRRDRDLLLVDQRGTGRSGPLKCRLYSPDDPAASLRDFFPADAARRCARELSKRADLTQYGYARFADDLEHVRRALGYGPLNLYAGSYGTRAAQVYLRAHPDSVRTVYFGSMVPIDVALPLPMARAAQLAIDATFDACAAQATCRDAYPNLRAEFKHVLARLDSGEVRVRVPGRDEPAPLHRGRVAEWLRARLYRAEGAAEVPWLIHRAYEGDWQPIADGILANAQGMDAVAYMGLFFAITCNEDVAFVHEADVAAQARGTFIGEYRLRQQQAACAPWPKATLAAGYRRPVRSDVPALFVSGDTDPATPLWFTEHAAPGFSRRLEVVLRGQGHTEWSDCVGALYERFVRSGSVDGLDGDCAPVPRPPFRTR